MVGIDGRVVEEERVVHQVHSLLLPSTEVSVDRIIKLLDLVVCVIEALIGPQSIVLNIVDLRSDRSNNTKVMASTFNGPP